MGSAALVALGIVVAMALSRKTKAPLSAEEVALIKATW